MESANDPLEGWHPADEAPKGIFDLMRPNHIVRSKPIWLLQGAFTYHHCEDPRHMAYGECDCTDATRTDPPKVVLGYCVWPLVRFLGEYKNHRRGKTGEYEQWLPTKDHYFVSLETDCEHIFPAQYWKEVEKPPVPQWAVDDGFRWGTRHCGWFGASELEVPAGREWLKGVRRASVENPFAEK